MRNLGLAITAGVIVLAGIGWASAHQPCQTLDCLINRHPAVTSCLTDDWECLVREQVHYAPQFVVDTATSYLTSQRWLDPADMSYVKTTVTMVSPPTESALYVNYHRQICDNVGWCSSRYGFILRYTSFGWEVVDIPWLSPPPFAGQCIDNWDYYLYGIQRDNALYYGRINTNHSICTKYDDRQVVRVDAQNKRDYLVHNAFFITPAPPG